MSPKYGRHRQKNDKQEKSIEQPTAQTRSKYLSEKTRKHKRAADQVRKERSFLRLFRVAFKLVQAVLHLQRQRVVVAADYLQHLRTVHTHTFNGPFSGTTRVSRYQKGKPIWILLKQETVSGSGISWAICKSAPRSRQITMPAPHHSGFTGRMLFLPPNQQRQNNEGKRLHSKVKKL